MVTWRDIWRKRSGGSTALEDLLRLDGYDTDNSRVLVHDWVKFVSGVRTALGARPGDSVYEVGCGSGAFLRVLHDLGHPVGGLDYSPLVETAKHLPGDFTQSGAEELSPAPYDLVISCSVFNYFESFNYAQDVLGKMVAKARRGVAVLDVNDAATRGEFLAFRRAAHPPGVYDKVYRGLDQLFFPRDWFAGFRTEGQCLAGYGNGKYRFNAYLLK